MKQQPSAPPIEHQYMKVSEWPDHQTPPYDTSAYNPIAGGTCFIWAPHEGNI